MNTFRLLLTCIAIFSVLTFTVLFGHIPTLRHTPVGWTNHFLTITIPSTLTSIDHTISGGRFSNYVKDKQKRIMNERHPTVLIMYLVLFLGGDLIYVMRVLPDLSTTHHFAVPILIVFPLITLYLAASTDPGYITAQNHAHYIEKYEYDGVLFRRGHECSTCLREKPARSKHCPLCDKCIAKHDHHCIWINSCVGERNMKWFLAFLCTNSITFTYASFVLYTRFRTLMTGFDEGRIVLDIVSVANKPSVWLALLKLDVLVGALSLFVVLCDLMVSAFLIYHSYLIFSGVTTNETLKFEDIREAIQAREIDLYGSVNGRYHLDVAGKPYSLDWSRLENVYDEGWRNNFHKILKT